MKRLLLVVLLAAVLTGCGDDGPTPDDECPGFGTCGAPLPSGVVCFKGHQEITHHSGSANEITFVCDLAGTPAATPTPTPTPSPSSSAAPAARPSKASRSRSLGTAKPHATGSLHWAALARCESGGDPTAVSDSGRYRGLYQFSRTTWASVGGAGDPAAASATEQTHRAELLYARDGRAPWPECGRLL